MLSQARPKPFCGEKVTQGGDEYLITLLGSHQCELDPLQITRLKKKYISLRFSFVYWFLNFVLPLWQSLHLFFDCKLFVAEASDPPLHHHSQHKQELQGFTVHINCNKC